MSATMGTLTGLTMSFSGQGAFLVRAGDADDVPRGGFGAQDLRDRGGHVVGEVLVIVCTVMGASRRRGRADHDLAGLARVICWYGR